MTQINPLQVEAQQLESGAQGGIHSIMTTLGGTMVEEYDHLLSSYNAEMVGINAAKSQARQDRNNVAMAGGTGQAYTMPEADADNAGAAGIRLNSDELEKLEEYAAAYGINISSIALNDPMYGLKSGDVNKNFVSNETLDSIKGAIDGRIEDLNGTSELKMIRFQSLMDARKQSMMMLSNMVSSDNSTKQSIIQNMKG